MQDESKKPIDFIGRNIWSYLDHNLLIVSRSIPILARKRLTFIIHCCIQASKLDLIQRARSCLLTNISGPNMSLDTMPYVLVCERQTFAWTPLNDDCDLNKRSSRGLLKQPSNQGSSMMLHSGTEGRSAAQVPY